MMRRRGREKKKKKKKNRTKTIKAILNQSESVENIKVRRIRGS
jgi:hypothetical protein